MTERPLPTYHFRPARGWINDPNGVVFRDGRWHMFYQHNPDAPVHSAIAWGHASTDDLMTWRDHPVAFGPTAGGPDRFGCWSGVAVTGLPEPAVAYSGVVDASARSTIVLRWGSDDLDTWGEPIVVGVTPDDAGVAIMRDPFVFSWEGRRWALVGAGALDGTPRILIYDCEDILDWQYRGVFLDGTASGLGHAATANIWECPQLMPAGEEGGLALVIVSLWSEGVLGDVMGITGRVVAGPGHPVFEAVDAQPVDTGDAFYAPQVALDPNRGAALMFGWVREEDQPAAHLVAGCLSLPRRVAVRDGVVSVTLDTAVADLPLAAPQPLAPGSHPLPVSAVVTLDEGEGRLVGPHPIDLLPGTVVYVDAGVAEVMRPGVVPATHRAEPGIWRLDLPEGAEARLRMVTAEGRTFPAR